MSDYYNVANTPNLLGIPIDGFFSIFTEDKTEVCPQLTWDETVNKDLCFLLNWAHEQRLKKEGGK
jgi:hypothetical protein